MEIEVGSVVELRDWDEGVVWMRVTYLFDSPRYGPSVSGPTFSTQRAANQRDRRLYVAMRALPRDRVVDRLAETAAQRDRRRDRDRARRAARHPVAGRCEHCGQPTKGGWFVPGHDAKLKAQLVVASQSPDKAVRVPAVAEGRLRAQGDRTSPWFLSGPARDEKEVAALVEQGEAFLLRQIQSRWT